MQDQKKNIVLVLTVLIVVIVLLLVWILLKKQSAQKPFILEPLTEQTKQEILKTLAPSPNEKVMSDEQKEQILESLSVPKQNKF